MVAPLITQEIVIKITYYHLPITNYQLHKGWGCKWPIQGGAIGKNWLLLVNLPPIGLLGSKLTTASFKLTDTQSDQIFGLTGT